MRSAALVTGASQGIGEAIARRLARDGFAVGLIARSRERLDHVVGEIRQAGHHAFAYPADVGRRADVARVLEASAADLGPVLALVNNAGHGGPFHRADEVDDAEWDRVFSTNLLGARYLCEALLPGMAARGGGRIVNIASIMGLFGGAGSSTYAASKHALIGYTRSIAVEWGGAGITCNAICPGYIETPMVGEESAYEPSAKEAIARRIPLGRFGRPEEIAAFVSFLTSPEAAYMNGGVFTIDGGLSAHVT